LRHYIAAVIDEFQLKRARHLAGSLAPAKCRRLESYLRSKLHRAIAADSALDQTEVDVTYAYKDVQPQIEEEVAESAKREAPGTLASI